MSDYIKSTDFASKDALASGNAAKIVKGTEIDTEFNNIATAVATKADLSSPPLTGNPTAPTQTAGNNSTRLATTAFVAAAISAAYPVGSIYINAAVATNPATLLGFGTWSAFGAGRVMVGLDAGNAAFDTAQETGGSADAIIPSHNHTATSTVTDPGHNHNLTNGTNVLRSGAPRNKADGSSADLNVVTLSIDTNTTGITVGTTVATAGVSVTNANLQPYIVVYMWRRTA
jgi:hypothetical protein